MAELKQTYCSCYTAVHSSKKSSSRILDFITKLSANRLRHRQLMGEIKQWTHGDSKGALEGAESLVDFKERLFKKFDQPQRSTSSDLHQRLCQCVNSSWRPKCFSCSRVRAPALELTAVPILAEPNVNKAWPTHSPPSLHLQQLLPHLSASNISNNY